MKIRISFILILVTSYSFSQKVNVDTDYEKGTLNNNYKDGIWQYFDNPGELSLKVNYSTGELLFISRDTGEYIINQNGTWIKSSVSMQPRYIGSMVEFYKIVSANIDRNEVAKDSTIGNSYIAFEVDTAGQANSFQIIAELGKHTSAEMLKAVKLIPNLWIPASINGKKYSARFLLPVSFIGESKTNLINQKEDRINELPTGKFLEPVQLTLPFGHKRLSDEQKLVGRWQDENSIFVLSYNYAMFAKWNTGERASGKWELWNGLLYFLDLEAKVFSTYKILELTEKTLSYQKIRSYKFLKNESELAKMDTNTIFHAVKIADD